MDSFKQPQATPKKGRLARAFAKVLNLRKASGIAPVVGLQKVKSQGRKKMTADQVKVEQAAGSQQHKSFVVKEEDLRDTVVKPQANIKKVTAATVKVAQTTDGQQHKSFVVEEEDLHNKVAREALLAKVFASISTIKAAYAQLQFAESPYDYENVQSSDKIVVSELKNISEFKQCFLKKQLDPNPEEELQSAELKEQKSIVKTYKVMGKKLQYQLKLQDSRITCLREKLKELKQENRSMEKQLNASGPLLVLDNLHLSGLSPNHFIPVLHHAVRSIRSFVKLTITEMQSAGLDVAAVVSVIQPGVVYWNQEHKCFTFESFVCREMFDSFQYPNFSMPNEPTLPEPKKRRHLFFERFNELKSVKAKDYLARKPMCTFGKFCRAKYLRLIHPKMEASIFGNTNQRDLVNAGGFPGTEFFNAFAEMAKWVWLLHCMAFSFSPAASIFQVKRRCRFSEVYMESVADEAFLEPQTCGSSGADQPCVAFTVVPGFKIGKTVIQCQVYLERPMTNY